MKSYANCRVSLAATTTYDSNDVFSGSSQAGEEEEGVKKRSTCPRATAAAAAAAADPTAVSCIGCCIAGVLAGGVTARPRPQRT